MNLSLETVSDTQATELKQLLVVLKKTKEEAAAKGHEETANRYWRELEALELNALYINAFDKIKRKKYRDAWVELEQCEIKCKFIQTNSDPQFLERARIGFISEKVEKLQSLYPYCLFASPEFIVGHHACSICGHRITPRSRCEHKKGKIYNGELCVHIVHDLEFRGISLVANPVQKYSVLHNDETLNFSLLDHLFEVLEDPFEEWDARWTTKAFSIEQFSNVDPDSHCPCGSKKSFESCCIEKDEVILPHVDFVFSREIPITKQAIRLTF